MDTYGTSGITLLFIACFETIVIAWVYGKSHHGLAALCYTVLFSMRVVGLLT